MVHRKLWNKDFILMLQGNAVSAIGDVLYSVAIGYWVYDQTGSSALMGMMSSISMFISMFLMPFAGSIVDKCNRKWIIVGMDALRGVIMLAVGALAFAGQLKVSIVLAAAGCASLCSVFFSPAASTLMIDIIPRDDMVRGQSVHSGTVSLVNLAGKAFSGVLVAFFGVPLVIVINGVCYLISALTELFIHVPKTVGQGTQVTVKTVVRDFGMAVKQIFADPFLRLLVLAVLLLNLISAGPFMLMVPFCTDKGFSETMYGILMSVQTAASMITVVMLGIFKLRPKIRFALLCIGFSLASVFWCGMYLSTGFLWMCVMMFLGSVMNMLGNAILNATLTLALPEVNRGAILGFITAASTGGCAVSALIYGALGEVFPLYLVFTAGTLLSVLPTLYFCVHRRTKEFILTH